jgi:hypothetical protein
MFFNRRSLFRVVPRVPRAVPSGCCALEACSFYPESICRRNHIPVASHMKTFLKALSFAGLILMFVASVLVFQEKMTHETYRMLGLIGTVMWFAAVPFWMKRRLGNSE